MPICSQCSNWVSNDSCQTCAVREAAVLRRIEEAVAIEIQDYDERFMAMEETIYRLELEIEKMKGGK